MKTLGISMGIGVALIGAFALFVQKRDVFHQSILLSLMYLGVYAVFGFYYLKEKNDRKSIILICMFFVAFEVGLNQYNTGFSTVSRTKYVTKKSALEGIELAVNGNDARFDTNVRMTKNDGPLSSLHTATIFSSTTNYGMYQFYQNMGMDYSKVYYCYEGATPMTSALLGVTYFIGSQDEDFSDAFHTNRQIVMDHALYELPTTSFAYALPTSVTEDFYQLDDSVDRLNALGAELGAQSPLYWECSVLEDGDKRQIQAIGEGTYYVKLSGASKTNGDTLVIEVLDKNGNTIRTKKYKNARKGFLLNVGLVKDGERALISTETGSLSSVTVKAYYQDDARIRTALRNLSANPAKDIIFYQSDLSGNLLTTQRMAASTITPTVQRNPAVQ